MVDTRPLPFRRRIGLHAMFFSVLGRFVRRSFFRLVLLAFLLVVAVFVVLMLAANRENANSLLEMVSGGVLDTRNAELVWERDRSQITGPSLSGTGEIRYYGLRIRRKGGPTPHPTLGSLQYDFLSVPEVRLHYDLKRLPQPVTNVEFPDGLTLHFNIYRGEWLDADLFQTGTGEAKAPTLPSVVVGGEARVMLRADGILEPPESLSRGEVAHWYPLALEGLSLLPGLEAADEFELGGAARLLRVGQTVGAPLAGFALSGRVRRDGTSTTLQFGTQESIAINQEFVSMLAPEVRATVDQFQIEAIAEINGKLDIEPNRPLNLTADVSLTEGSLCFMGFPLRVGDASALVRIENNNLRVQARGRRDGADVAVTADVDAVGTDRESLVVNVRVRNLLVDENFRLALLPARLQPGNAMDWTTGMPWPEDQFDPRDPEMAPDPGFPEWPGRPTWDGGLISPQVDPVLPFICRAFAPMGLANFELTLRNEAKGRLPGVDGRPGPRTIEETLTWKAFIRDATACYVGVPEQPGGGFPIPLSRCYGVVEGTTLPGQAPRYVVRGYTPEELQALGDDARPHMEAFGARGMTGVLATPSQRVWLNAVYVDDSTGGRRPELVLTLETSGVDFSPEFQRRIPEGVRNALAPFAPEGLVDVQRARVALAPDDTDSLTFEFDLTARNVAAQYKFEDAQAPMRFNEVSGSISIDSQGNRVRLNSIRGKLLGSEIILEALQFNDGAVPRFVVRATDFVLRPELEAMMPAVVATVLRRFQLSGRVSLDVEGRRGAEGPDFTQAVVGFRGGEMQFDQIPYSLRDVEGRVHVHVHPASTFVTVHEVVGRAGDPANVDRARIAISGTAILPMPQGNAEPVPILDLRVNARRVPVDAALLSAMTPLVQATMPPGDGPPEKPALIQFIESLRVTGTIGAHGRVISTPEGEFAWRMEVTLENTGINFSRFEYPLEGLNGVLVIDGTDVSLRNVVGRAEDGTFTLHHAGYTDTEGWTVLLSARNMSFHATPTLRRALPEALRNIFDRMNPRGRFDIDVELSGREDAMRFHVSLDVFKTALDLGLHFDDMTARFDYEGVIDGENTRSNGHLYVSEVFFKRARFNDLSSSFQYFGERLEFPNLRGRFYDGWIEARFGMEAERYSGELVVRRADLSQLGATAFGTEELAGVMDAEIRFHSWLDSDGQIGRGRVDIGAINRNSDHPDPEVRASERECRLAAVPLFNEIFRVVGGEQNFDEGHVYFWLSPDRITIREMDFVSDAARVEIFGGDDENFIMYDTAEMRMKLFFTIAPRSPIPLPLVQQVLDLLKQILFPLYVTGSLGEPRVEPFSLSTEELEKLQDQFPRRPRGP